MSPFEKITSRDNKRLKDAKRVRDGRSDKLIFVEGLRLCREALSAGLRIQECFVTREIIETDGGATLTDDALRYGAEVFELSKSLSDSIADTKNSQGIVMICQRPQNMEATDVSSHDGRLPILVVAAGVNNPSNLGAIMRVAEAANVSGLVTTKGSADAFSPKSLRASMGSAFRLSIKENVDLDAVVRWARAEKIRITAAAGGGSGDYTSVDWKLPRLLIFGSEAHGLGSNELVLMDETIRIPMNSNVESLNLAVACGVILFEARRQVLT